MSSNQPQEPSFPTSIDETPEFGPANVEYKVNRSSAILPNAFESAPASTLNNIVPFLAAVVPIGLSRTPLVLCAMN